MLRGRFQGPPALSRRGSGHNFHKTLQHGFPTTVNTLPSVLHLPHCSITLKVTEKMTSSSLSYHRVTVTCTVPLDESGQCEVGTSMSP